MPVTKVYTHDFSTLPSKTFRFTITAPNGDKVKYPELTGEQADQLWRLWRDGEQYALGWDLTWAGNNDGSKRNPAVVARQLDEPMIDALRYLDAIERDDAAYLTRTPHPKWMVDLVDALIYLDLVYATKVERPKHRLTRDGHRVLAVLDDRPRHKLSQPMIRALRYLDAVQRNDRAYLARTSYPRQMTNTVVALIDRGLVSTSQTVGVVHPLTDEGRRALAALDA